MGVPPTANPLVSHTPKYCDAKLQTQRGPQPANYRAPCHSKTPEISVPKSENRRERRWLTKTEPRIKVVKVCAKSILKCLLGHRPSRQAILSFRTRQTEMVKTDAEDLKEWAHLVDSTIRRHTT